MSTLPRLAIAIGKEDTLPKWRRAAVLGIRVLSDDPAEDDLLDIEDLHEVVYTPEDEPQ